MLKAYSLDARIASIGSQLIDHVHQVAKNLENLPVYKNPHTRTNTCEEQLQSVTLGRFTFWVSLSLRPKTETKRLKFGLSHE